MERRILQRMENEKKQKKIKSFNWTKSLETVQKLKPKDDIFFGMIMKNKEVCQEVLRVILGDPGLIVESCEDQKSFTNAVMRSVRVDAFCKFSTGEYSSVEMQRASEEGSSTWHEQRVRYNASSITVNIMPKGADFSELPKLYMIYITENDIFGQGKSLYRIVRMIDSADCINIRRDNGLYEYYANLAVDDKTLVAELLHLFNQNEVIENTKFPKFTACVKYFKENEEGVKTMCSILQELVEEGREEGRTKERAENLVNYVQNIMKAGYSLEEACRLIGRTIKEYEDALKFIQEEESGE